MLKVKLLFFATLRDFMGMRETEIVLPAGTTVTELKRILSARFVKAGPTLDTALVSVNKEFAFDRDEIPDGAEIALFPPVSGG